eukprot:6921183-Pyramimonas_sp.AAC.1
MIRLSAASTRNAPCAPPRRADPGPPALEIVANVTGAGSNCQIVKRWLQVLMTSWASATVGFGRAALCDEAQPATSSWDS